ncbi:hypothetical protein ABZW44_42255 [Streptomyces mirabilis]|jgi:hypothetical protein|uniref:hypothetical protein n=1 Tax=Streptomyces TaxID=1883 RepID=UPI000BD4519B|nr:hypothetical protein [Streptomyces sp. OV198]SOE47793.1 hypothetical protein SAMN05446589_0158 [Streptomyces sp. OV198]
MAPLTTPRRVLVLTASLTAAVTLLAGGTASAATSEYYKTFTSGANYLTKSDTNGTLNAQVTWPTTNKPLAWSFDISRALERTATGNMRCTARVPSFPNYNDDHPSIPVDYKWHSTVPGQHRLNTSYWYVLNAQCKFPSTVNGTRGTTTVTLKFNYKMSSASASTQGNGPAYRSHVSFTPS